MGEAGKEKGSTRAGEGGDHRSQLWLPLGRATSGWPMVRAVASPTIAPLLGRQLAVEAADWPHGQ
jgi:hypothetical protein